MTSKNVIMHMVHENISGYNTPYKANTSSHAISGFRLNKEVQFESNAQPFFVNQLMDYQESYKALISQRAIMASLFNNTQNKEFNQAESKIEITNEENKPRKTTYCRGVSIETWALTDPKYNDKETGISWYVRDGKYPYMLGEDTKKFRKIYLENGEFALYY